MHINLYLLQLKLIQWSKGNGMTRKKWLTYIFLVIVYPPQALADRTDDVIREKIAKIDRAIGQIDSSIDRAYGYDEASLRHSFGSTDLETVLKKLRGNQDKLREQKGKIATLESELRKVDNSLVVPLEASLKGSRAFAELLEQRLDNTYLAHYLNNKIEKSLGTKEFCDAITHCQSSPKMHRPRLKGLFTPEPNKHK